VALALACALLPARVAHAHTPAILDASTPYVVADPTVSRALYGTVRQPDDVFVLRMHVAARLAIPFEMLIPHRGDLRDHRPAYAVIGVGLPPLDDAAAARLPRALPVGAGAFVDWNDHATRDVVFESFLRRVYWSSGAIALRVPAGDVEVWIWSPAGTTGDFVLGFGVEEGGQDYGDVLSHWSDYAY